MNVLLKILRENFSIEVIHFEELHDVEFPMEATLGEQLTFVRDIDPNHTLMALLEAEAEYNELVGTLDEVQDTLSRWNLNEEEGTESEIHQMVKDVLLKHQNDE